MINSNHIIQAKFKEYTIVTRQNNKNNNCMTNFKYELFKVFY